MVHSKLSSELTFKNFWRAAQSGDPILLYEIRVKLIFENFWVASWPARISIRVTMGTKKFSKVSSLLKSLCNIAVKLTFEELHRSHQGLHHGRDDDQKFSKVSSTVMLQGVLSWELTFEKFYQILPFLWPLKMRSMKSHSGRPRTSCLWLSLF